MLLIIEHSRGKGEFAGYSYVSERDDNHALGVLGLDATDDAARMPRYEILGTISMGLSTTGFSCRASRPIGSGIRATSNGSAASKIAMNRKSSLVYRAPMLAISHE